MNILMISPDAPPHKGGISRLVSLLRKGLEERGHQVSLVHPTVRIKELKFSTIPFCRYNDKYDLIHLHGPTPFLSDLTLLIKSKFPIVYTHHAEASWLSEKCSEIYRRIHHFLVKRARMIIVHSHDYARLFRGLTVAVVPMPCPFRPPKNFEVEEKPYNFTVLYVGQLRPFKGVDLFIKAASMLKDVDFVIAGDGYLRPRLIDVANDLRNVRFVGSISDDELLRLYRSAHVICLPSKNTTEAYGLVLIEGALYGCVPVASNLMGVRENVSQLRGCLFEPGSDRSLAGKIRMLSSKREWWLNLARRSKQAADKYVSMYPVEYYVRRHEEIFTSVCS